MSKKIANELILEKKTAQPLEVLDLAIKSFKIDSDSRERLENTRKDFLIRFPKNELQKLTLETYCIGRDDKESFCWWIEHGLRHLGTFSPGNSTHYLLYWNKGEQVYKKHGYVKNLEDDVAIATIANDLQNLVSNKSLLGENESKFGRSFMLKILSTYYPEEFFPVNSEKHLDNIIKLFDLEAGGDILKKNSIVYQFCKDKIEGTELTPNEFCWILYNSFNIKEGELKDGEHGEIIIKGGWQFVQFHPSYDYTDFVEGLRPIKELDDKEFSFKLRDGTFKSFCKQAVENPNKKFVFIIDEINRGEISKIFGELFFSIDPGYRGISGKVVTQYANMQDDSFSDSVELGEFYVPENIYIIGTMNDIDRSVESFDFAMRRRFTWIEVKASDRIAMWDGEIDAYINEAEIKLTALNNAIEKIQGLNSSYHIGPAYFLKLKNYTAETAPFEKL